ncbi:preprotein translocase subunit TatA (plasmid) [Gemmobacter aquarius]|uniref:Protein MgtC n=1 Tax=Paragemmobacter aquarius TaxID=2169400 RepID=A0A2S0US24_9RHOB|nr:MgtC/SapB family protein [Gemmobacter aquarius]AWB50616.1 preprotein translocase subunit TatA [Gemmobacter aquarius]
MDAIIEEVARAPALAWEVIALRMLGAVIFCGLIGIEREHAKQAAGLRTHILVGLAACLYSILTLDLASRFEGDEAVKMDPLRIVEAVTGGVAFLAAGMIVFSNGAVRGLTTGAGMWLAAAVGLAVGLGLWGVAAMATVLAVVVMSLLVVQRD